MTRTASLYQRHRFPPEIIQHAVWLHHRFNLSACRFKSALQAQRLFGLHAALYNLFNLGRHLSPPSTIEKPDSEPLRPGDTQQELDENRWPGRAQP